MHRIDIDRQQYRLVLLAEEGCPRTAGDICYVHDLAGHEVGTVQRWSTSPATSAVPKLEPHEASRKVLEEVARRLRGSVARVERRDETEWVLRLCIVCGGEALLEASPPVTKGWSTCDHGHQVEFRELHHMRPLR
jgi:hypothetical protein